MRIIDWSSDVCSSDLLAAVFAKGGDDDIVRVLAKVEALGRFLMEEDGGNLLVAYRRANNIVRAEMKKTPELTLGEVDGKLITVAEERLMVAALAEDRQSVVRGKRVSGSVELVGGRIIKKK